MPNLKTNALLLGCFLLLSLDGLAKENTAIKTLKPLFIEAVKHETVPGISVAVADKNGLIWAEGFGLADIENQVPMSPSHILRIGSVAKVMTTAAMMRMQQQNKIDLDIPVTHYSQDWPASHADITLRQLAAHTSGVRHYKQGANEFLLNQVFSDMKSSLALFKDDPLLFEPGTQHQYSTFAWTLVSAAMEGADKNRDFEQIMQQEVFEPLALRDTHFDDQYKIIPNRARPYSYYKGDLSNSPQTNHSYKWAGGGFISSPSDVSRFAVAHFDEQFLTSETVRLMFKKAKLDNGQTLNFGIGWQISFDHYKGQNTYQNKDAQAMMEAMPNVVMHSGGSMGGTTMLILCTDHGRAVTVVKNVNGDNNANVFLLALQTLSFYHQH